MTTHHEYMSLALQLAERGRTTVSPNPMVGCIIVKNKQIIAEGYHQQAGKDHAEIVALEQAGANAKESSVYVTLEPCCHYGRTPPCVDALIRAQVKEVFIACQDPNSLVAGKGIIALQNANIHVEVGLGENEATALNEIFFHYIKTKRPFVIAKWAMSLDGKTVTHLEDSRQISSSTSQRHTHQLRQQVDAILIGAQTAIHDDPQLTVRLPHTNPDKQPCRIVLSSDGNLPAHLKILTEDLPGKTIIATTNPDGYSHFNKKITVLILPPNKNGKVDLPSLLQALGKLEITSLLVEGGKATHEDFFRENLVNKIQVYLAPVIIGALEKKQTVHHLQMLRLDNDFNFTAHYGEKNHV